MGVARAADELEQCVKLVEADLSADPAVGDLVGIAGERYGLLSRELLLPISPRGEEDVKATARLRQLLGKTPLGLPFPKDRVPGCFEARVIAARIRHWLEGIVLPRQDPLVDAPHLVAEVPGLLSPADPANSQVATTKLHTPHAGLGLRDGKLQDFTGPEMPWVSRPTWWRPEYLSAASLDDFRSQHDDLAGRVFCEDTSTWHPQDRCRSFRAGTGGTTSRRWIEGVTGVDYEPAGRLLT